LLCVLVSGTSSKPDERHSQMYRSIVPEQGGAVEGKKNVFVLTLPRSGSTFVGEVFRQSSEFVYLFEATRGLGDVHLVDNCATTPDKWEEDLVVSMFNCDFWPMRNYMNELSANRSHIYSWGFVQEHSSSQTMLNRCFQDPHKENLKQSVVIKEITMWGPKLKWLYDTLGSDLRIVWLVRDIRGWVSSWLPKTGSGHHDQNMYVSWEMNKQDLWARYDRCRGLQEISPSLLSTEQLQHLKTLMQDTSKPAHQRMAAWWTVENSLLLHYLSQLPQENFMLISYEHMSKYPVEVTQQLYQFLGKPVVPKDIMQWIFQNTASKGDADRYSTARDSEKMATVWRERLTAGQLREVEIIGEPLFEFFNYTISH